MCHSKQTYTHDAIANFNMGLTSMQYSHLKSSRFFGISYVNGNPEVAQDFKEISMWSRFSISIHNTNQLIGCLIVVKEKQISSVLFYLIYTLQFFLSS